MASPVKRSTTSRSVVAPLAAKSGKAAQKPAKAAIKAIPRRRRCVSCRSGVIDSINTAADLLGSLERSRLTTLLQPDFNKPADRLRPRHVFALLGDPRIERS